MSFLFHFILNKRNISNQEGPLLFLTFSKRWGIECASFVSMYSLRSHFSRQSWVAFWARPVFCGLDLCTLSHQWHSKCSDQVSLLLQWFFWYNIWQILLTPSLSRFWSARRFFCLKLSTFCWSYYLHTVVLKTLILWSLSFFSYPSCLIITLINSFSIEFLEKLSKQTAFGLHFRERAEKIKKRQKYKIRKPTNGQEKYCRKKQARVHIWQKISKTSLFLQILV